MKKSWRTGGQNVLNRPHPLHVKRTNFTGVGELNHLLRTRHLNLWCIFFCMRYTITILVLGSMRTNNTSASRYIKNSIFRSNCPSMTIGNRLFIWWTLIHTIWTGCLIHRLWSYLHWKFWFNEVCFLCPMSPFMNMKLIWRGSKPENRRFAFSLLSTLTSLTLLVYGC